MRDCQLAAMSLDIPEGMPVHDMQTDFPWAYENTAQGTEMLSRVLKVRAGELPRLGSGALSAFSCVTCTRPACQVLGQVVRLSMLSAREQG